MIWVVETKDGEPKFAHVKRDVCLDYFALLGPGDAWVIDGLDRSGKRKRK